MNGISDLHLWIATNYKILWGELIHCSTVEFLKMTASGLLGIILVKLALHHFYLLRLKGRSPLFCEADHPRLFRIFEQARSKTEISTRPTLHYYTTGPFLAFTTGVLQPAIFLDPHMVEQMDDEELEAILVHELHHVRRKDNLKAWLYDLFGAMLPVLAFLVFGIYFVVSLRHSWLALLEVGLVIFGFFYFKQWWSKVREKTCDDCTVHSTGKPLALASSLLKAWSFLKEKERRWHAVFNPGHHILRGHSCLEGRIHRLVHPKNYKVFRLFRHGVVVSFWALVFLASLFLARFHIMGSYDGLQLKFTTTEQGCPHPREGIGPNCQITFGSAYIDQTGD